MCTQPLTIQNRSTTYNIYHKSSYQVNCCHCPDCLEERANQYMLRNWYEYEKIRLAKLKGFSKGFSLFVGLSYDEHHVPRHGGIMTFDTEDIKKYHKRLRRYLEYHYGFDKDAFKFWLVCEYGGLFGRPHYHLIYHVYVDIDKYDFARAIIVCWQNGFTDLQDLDTKSLHFGHFSERNCDDHILVSPAAIKYISKYLKKYDDTNKYIKESLTKQFVHAGKVADLDKLNLNRYKPFIRQSLNLGYDDTIDMLICDHFNVPKKNGKYKAYMMGNYYLRKQFYSKIMDPKTNKPLKTEKGSYQYYLNEKGRQYKKKILSQQIKAKYNKLMSLVPVTDGMTPLMDQLNEIGYDMVDVATYDVCLRGQQVLLPVLADNLDSFDFARALRETYISKLNDDYDSKDYEYFRSPRHSPFELMDHIINLLQNQQYTIEYIKHQHKLENKLSVDRIISYSNM